jgi:hypothetical protein
LYTKRRSFQPSENYRPVASALASKAAAIERTIRLLEGSGVSYIQPLPGKLIIKLPLGITAGMIVTFWPARGRFAVREAAN